MSPKEYRAARESASVTVLQMAKLLGVTRKTMYRREMPGAVISQEMAIAQRQVLRRIRSDHIAGVEPVKPARKPHKKRRVTNHQKFTELAAALSPKDTVQANHEAMAATAASITAFLARDPPVPVSAFTFPPEQPVNPTPDNPPIESTP